MIIHIQRPCFAHLNIDQIIRTKVLHHLQKQEIGHINLSNGMHSGLNFVTPVQCQCHTGEHIILEKRQKVYEIAKAKHPEHWTQGIRNWSPKEKVALNPMRHQDKTNQ